MQIFLDGFAETLAEDEHAVMVLDGAGWHGAKALAVRIHRFEPLGFFVMDQLVETFEGIGLRVFPAKGESNVSVDPLAVPPNVTLVPLPPCSPQLNPMGRVWLYLRERFLSLRLMEGYDAIVDACCIAWNAIADDADRIRSLCRYPYIQKGIG